MKLLLVDSQVKGYESIESAVVSDVHVITYDSKVDTYDSITEKITGLSRVFDSVGLVFHFKYGSNFQLLANEKVCNIGNYESFSEFKDFLSKLNTNTIDLITCNIFMYLRWQNVIKSLETDLNINIRASDNETGNFGDWVMESDNVDIKNVYFSEDISKYVGSLGTNFLANNLSYNVSNALNNKDPQFVKGGSVYVWGAPDNGGATTYNGTFGAIPDLTTVIAIYSTQFAFAALLEDRSVYVWGDPVSGGSNIYNDASTQGLIKVDGKVLYGVKTIRATWGSFAAILTNGTVCVWGNPNEGGSPVFGSGDSPAIIPGLNGVVKMYSGAYSFCALTESGKVWTWGSSLLPSPIYGNGDAQVISEITPGSVSKIYSNQSAFAILKKDGTVFVWGNSLRGGSPVRTATISTTFGTLTDFASSSPVSGVVNIFATQVAFAALKNDGTVFVWGRIFFGGSYIYGDPAGSYITISELANVKTIYSNQGAFAALTNSGDVWVWGDPASGGSNTGLASASQGKINGSIPIKSISSTLRSFAAITTTNDVYLWGNPALGGSPVYNSGTGVFTKIPELSPVKQIYGTYTAYTAIKKDGSVWVWGDPSFGGAPVLPPTGTGNVIEYPELNNNVSTIYNNFNSFTAVKKNGALQVWGYPTAGGDQTQVNDITNPSDIKFTDAAYAALLGASNPLSLSSILFITLAAVAVVAIILVVISKQYTPYIALFGFIAVIGLLVAALLV